jgi:hypothetical protein
MTPAPRTAAPSRGLRTLGKETQRAEQNVKARQCFRGLPRQSRFGASDHLRNRCSPANGTPQHAQRGSTGTASPSRPSSSIHNPSRVEAHRSPKVRTSKLNRLPAFPARTALASVGAGDWAVVVVRPFAGGFTGSTQHL